MADIDVAVVRNEAVARPHAELLAAFQLVVEVQDDRLHALHSVQAVTGIGLQHGPGRIQHHHHVQVREVQTGLAFDLHRDGIVTEDGHDRGRHAHRCDAGDGEIGLQGHVELAFLRAVNFVREVHVKEVLAAIFHPARQALGRGAAQLFACCQHARIAGLLKPGLRHEAAACVDAATDQGEQGEQGGRDDGKRVAPGIACKRDKGAKRAAEGRITRHNGMP